MRPFLALIAGLALAACQTVPAVDPPFLPPSGVALDAGGNVMTYAYGVGQLAKSGTPYAAPRDCRSACTMLMAVPNACWPADGVLRFHSASFSGDTSDAAAIDDANRFLASHYPPRLAAWFLSPDGPGGQRSTRVVSIPVRRLNAEWGADLRACR